MKGPNDYRDLVKKLRGETECYPDECEYCSAEGKCRCQRIGEACDAIEELVPYLEYYIKSRKELAELIASFCGPFEIKNPARFGVGAMTRGQHMRACRKAAGLTLRELSEKSGVHFGTINRLERGHNDGSISTIELLADTLGLSIDEYTGHERRSE